MPLGADRDQLPGHGTLSDHLSEISHRELGSIRCINPYVQVGPEIIHHYMEVALKGPSMSRTSGHKRVVHAVSMVSTTIAPVPSQLTLLTPGSLMFSKRRREKPKLDL